jgi:hypothetical protein
MNLKTILVVLLLAGGGVGAYFFFTRAPELPELVLLDEDGSQFSLDSLRGENFHLVLVLLTTKDPVSAFTARIIQEARARLGAELSFAGLVFQGGAADRQRFASENGLTFPLYPLHIQSAPNPFAVQQFFELAGKSHGLRGAMIQSGTILVVDARRRLQVLLTGEDAQLLPEKLQKLGY